MQQFALIMLAMVSVAACANAGEFDREQSCSCGYGENAGRLVMEQLPGKCGTGACCPLVRSGWLAGAIWQTPPTTTTLG